MNPTEIRNAIRRSTDEDAYLAGKAAIYKIYNSDISINDQMDYLEGLQRHIGGLLGSLHVKKQEQQP